MGLAAGGIFMASDLAGLEGMEEEEEEEEEVFFVGEEVRERVGRVDWRV
jgi:hypothetical protein